MVWGKGAVVEMLGCAHLEDVVGHQIWEFALPEYTHDWAFLQEQLWAHQLAARERGLALELNLPTGALQANLNADAFGRVVDNLVSNALKFAPAGGRVTVGLAECPGCVRLTVRDTGIGILEALQADLLEKFSPVARLGVGGETSTGLGLFITKQIVQRHRGKVWVESREGEEACFFVELH